MYALDSSERIPPNNGNDQNGFSAASPYYPNTWCAGWLDNNASVPDNTNTLFLMRSHLYPYHNSLSVWKCPADKSLDRGKKMARVRSMSMNNWLNSASEWTAGYRIIRKTTDMTEPAPAQTWILLDEREDSINDGFFVVDMKGWPGQGNQVILVDFPASYHNGAGGLNFADGHAEIHKWLDPRTVPRLKQGQNLTLNIPSPNNRDIIWLQERTTGKK